MRRWMYAVQQWRPDVVVTDFEPLSGIYARSSRTPLVCVDNIHMIDRCRHDDGIIGDARDGADGGRLAVSLLSEAVYLGKPVLSVPLRGQFEQLMNARYLQRAGFGMCAPAVDPWTLEGFIAGLDGFHDRLRGYRQDGNVEALAAIEERVAAAGRDSRRERARARRHARAMQR